MRDVPKADLVQTISGLQGRLASIQTKARRASEVARQATAEVIKGAAAVAGGAAAAALEVKAPDYANIGQTEIPTSAALGAGLAVGSAFIGGDVGGIVRGLGVGMLAAAAYRVTKDQLEGV